MNKEIVQEKQVLPANNVERTIITENSRPDPPQLLSKIVYTIFSILLAVLTLRFVFVLFGANPSNGLVNFFYTLTEPFVSPFRNIFSSGEGRLASETGGRFELETLLAIIFLILLGWVITVIIRTFDRRVEA